MERPIAGDIEAGDAWEVKVSKSRYKNYWYGIVLKMIKQYPEIRQGTSMQEYIFTRAIEKALEDTGAIKETGQLRVQAVRWIYFEDSKSVDGAADRCNVSRGTMLRWLQAFVRQVARNAGYM